MQNSVAIQNIQRKGIWEKMLVEDLREKEVRFKVGREGGKEGRKTNGIVSRA